MSTATPQLPAPDTAFRRLRERIQRHRLGLFVVRRIFAGMVLLVGVSFLIFLATNVLPGDVASAVLGRQATPEALAGLRAELGLDRPLLAQYYDWFTGVLQGDLGNSLAGARQPITELLANNILNTFILTSVTVLFLVPLSLGLGIVAGIRARRTTDHVISGLMLALIAIPEFVVGSILVIIFSVTLQMLPAVALVPPGTNPLSDPSLLVLPVATLLFAGVPYMCRIIRAGVAETTDAEYVQMGRLSGFSEKRVIATQILPNALAPSIQAFASTLQWLIGGVFVVETLFAYPGVGRALVEAVTVRDMPVVQALSLFIAAIYIAINLVADILIVLVVPKLRTSQ